MMLDVAPFFEDGAVSTKPVADGAVYDIFPSGASAGSWDQARRELKCVLQAVGCLCWANGLVTRGSRGNQGETSNPKG